jgi:DNA-binding GntR family transcriptional regulator
VSAAPIPADVRSWLARHARPGVPKYVALRDAIVASVASGRWPGGARLPTESEWAAQVPLSLGTIQRALRMLVDEGVVVRTPGQGSFIARRDATEMRSPLHCRFVDDAGDGYLPVYSKVIARASVEMPGAWSEHLQPAGEVVRIDRVLDINKEFLVFSRFYVDPARVPAFATLPTRKLSGENFKEIIWRESHQGVARMVQHLSTLAFPADVAGAIELKPRTPGSLLEVRAYLGGDSPIYYQELYIPNNRRRLRLGGD